MNPTLLLQKRECRFELSETITAGMATPPRMARVSVEDDVWRVPVLTGRGDWFVGNFFNRGEKRRNKAGQASATASLGDDGIC